MHAVCKSAKTLRDLVRLPGGEGWRKQKGTSVDTSEDLLVLHDYARKSAEKHKEARSILDSDKPESLDIAGDSDSDPAVDDGFWERFNERQIARQNGDKKDGDCPDPSERRGLRGEKGTQVD